MARSIPLTQIKSFLVVDLEKSPLLTALTPEQLGAMVRHCRIDEIDLKDVRKPLNYQGQVVFVADGVFERVFFPDKKAVEDPNLAVVLNELHPGDIFGEHLLFSHLSKEQVERIGLRSRSKGRLVRFQVNRFKTYMDLWPSLKHTLLEMVINRDFEHSLRLGDSMAQLYHSDMILSRIESVADLLIDTLSGETEQKKVIQRRYVLSSSPKTIGVASEKKKIEQAYLSVSADKEDRIRKEGENTCFRTTKFGSGVQRKLFHRKITKDEYEEWLKNRVGNIIIKERVYLKDNPEGVKIVIDRFKGNLTGLVIVEADFDSFEASKGFTLPDFLQKGAKEVTEDKRYLNQSLAMTGLPGN